MMNHIFEFSLIVALLGIAHFLFLRKNKKFRFLRFYMTGGICIAAMLPLLPAVSSLDTQAINFLLPIVTIDGASDGSVTTPISSVINFTQLGIFIYCISSLILLFRFLNSLLKIGALIRNAEKQHMNGQEILISKELSDPCSFFNKIILPPLQDVDEATLETIIQHEQLHISYEHSSEKIFWEILSIALWWHPAIWYLKKQITLTHEYQVDAALSLDEEIENYQATLINLVIHPYNLKLVNPLTSNIKKRIKMMNSNNKFRTATYPLLAMILIAGAVIIHSCTKETIQEETAQNTKQSNEFNPETISSAVAIDTIVSWDPATMVETMEFIYSNAHKLPQFPGCEMHADPQEKIDCSTEKLLTYIYSNLRYPKAAKANKEEGKVVVELVINEEGNIHFKQYLKSPSDNLKQAVEAVLTQMNDEITWVPGEVNGKIVKAKFTLPVKFKL